MTLNLGINQLTGEYGIGLALTDSYMYGRDSSCRPHFFALDHVCR